MSLPTLPTHAIAHRLLQPAVEFTQSQFASLRLMDRLDEALRRLAGPEGSRRLIILAISRARPETPWMHDVQVPLQGSLQQLDDRITAAWTTERCDRVSVLIAHVLDLLHVLIGTVLTGELVKEVWPALVGGTPA